MRPCILHIRGRIATDRNATDETRIRVGRALGRPRRLCELHESKLPFVSLIEFMRFIFPLLFVHVSGVIDSEISTYRHWGAKKHPHSRFIARLRRRHERQHQA